MTEHIQSTPLPISCSFADIIAPITEKEFFDVYFGKKYLHIPGAAHKFQNVMTWEILTNLLNMRSIWSSKSLVLAKDRQIVPPKLYCEPGIDRAYNSVMIPNIEHVQQHLEEGATLVCNEIDQLNPGLSGICNALEIAINGKAQANLYCSSRQRQAFASHYDTHDVFAMHMEGEKIWRIFNHSEDLPIRHPDFQKPADQQVRERGDSYDEVTLRPGDFLYIPRGMYHDALSSSEACIHIAFGLTGYIGLEAITNLSAAMVHDPLIRQNMPRHQEGKAALKKHLKKIAEHVQKTLTNDQFVDATFEQIQNYHYARGSLSLPIQSKDIHFQVTAPDFKIMPAQGKMVLLNSQNQGVPIPPPIINQVKWIIEKQSFNRTEFTETFSESGIEILDQTLQNLENMKVIKRSA